MQVIEQPRLRRGAHFDINDGDRLLGLNGRCLIGVDQAEAMSQVRTAVGNVTLTVVKEVEERGSPLWSEISSTSRQVTVSRRGGQLVGIALLSDCLGSLGPLVLATLEGGAAEEAGLTKGDLIVAVNGLLVIGADNPTVAKLMAKVQPGESIALVVARPSRYAGLVKQPCSSVRTRITSLTSHSHSSGGMAGARLIKEFSTVESSCLIVLC